MIRRLRFVPATLVLGGLLPHLMCKFAAAQRTSAKSLTSWFCIGVIALTRFVLRRIGNRRGSLQPARSSSSDRQPRQGLHRRRRPQPAAGRPNGYTSKIAFADSRISKADTDGTQKDAIERGGSIEVFPDADLAKGRAEYIQGVLKNSGLGAEYDYVHGPVLVRVTGNLSPSKAQDYERALG